MNLDREDPPILIDNEAFSSALSAGELDACLQLLRSYGDHAPAAVALNRRLAEALFHADRRGEALECGRRAFALALGDPETARFCAWLFSNRTRLGGTD